MRYHAHMEFRVDGILAGEYKGRVGQIIAIDFSTWIITLSFPSEKVSGRENIVTGRQAVTLVNHETCTNPDCTADKDRTATEP